MSTTRRATAALPDETIARLLAFAPPHPDARWAGQRTLGPLLLDVLRLLELAKANSGLQPADVIPWIMAGMVKVALDRGRVTLATLATLAPDATRQAMRQAWARASARLSLTREAHAARIVNTSVDDWAAALALLPGLAGEFGV